MVKQLHIILTYNCSLRCHHCYVYSDQRATGNISLGQISTYLNEGRKVPDLQWIFFGGGEPFTRYPLLLKAIQKARKLNYYVGVETNGYFARTKSSGIQFLRPLANLGVKEIRISNDFFHYKKVENSPAKHALEAAQELGMSSTLVRTSFPGNNNYSDLPAISRAKVIDQEVMYIGRAAETQPLGQPLMDWKIFSECPREDLYSVERLFIDAYGYVQTCPGIAIGNAYQTPLNEIITNFDIHNHPILGPLLENGPSGLITDTTDNHEGQYIDACHCCYSIRHQIIDDYSEWLGPRHVYGY